MSSTQKAGGSSPDFSSLGMVKYASTDDNKDIDKAQKRSALGTRIMGLFKGVGWINNNTIKKNLANDANILSKNLNTETTANEITSNTLTTVRQIRQMQGIFATLKNTGILKTTEYGNESDKQAVDSLQQGYVGTIIHIKENLNARIQELEEAISVLSDENIDDAKFDDIDFLFDQLMGIREIYANILEIEKNFVKESPEWAEAKTPREDPMLQKLSHLDKSLFALLDKKKDKYFDIHTLPLNTQHLHLHRNRVLNETSHIRDVMGNVQKLCNRLKNSTGADTAAINNMDTAAINNMEILINKVNNYSRNKVILSMKTPSKTEIDEFAESASTRKPMKAKTPETKPVTPNAAPTVAGQGTVTPKPAPAVVASSGSTTPTAEDIKKTKEKEKQELNLETAYKSFEDMTPEQVSQITEEGIRKKLGITASNAKFTEAVANLKDTTVPFKDVNVADLGGKKDFDQNLKLSTALDALRAGSEKRILKGLVEGKLPNITFKKPIQDLSARELQTLANFMRKGDPFKLAQALAKFNLNDMNPTELDKLPPKEKAFLKFMQDLQDPTKGTPDINQLPYEQQRDAYGTFKQVAESVMGFYKKGQE